MWIDGADASSHGVSISRSGLAKDHDSHTTAVDAEDAWMGIPFVVGIGRSDVTVAGICGPLKRERSEASRNLAACLKGSLP